MNKIIDLTKDRYPNLPGAEFLEFLSDDIPAGVRIFKSNVFYTSDNEEEVFGESTWGWESEHGFSSHFNTPEDALANYFEAIKNR